MIQIINGVTVEEGSGNPYADVGLPDADEMLAKARLTSKLEETLNNVRMTHAQAAQLCAVPASWFTDLLLGKFREIRTEQIVACQELLDQVSKQSEQAGQVK